MQKCAHIRFEPTDDFNRIHVALLTVADSPERKRP
jgi:hypothetical protein